MAAPLFGRVKTWIKEKLYYQDLNAEFNNIITNAIAAMLGGYSTNTAEMRKQTNPGTQGAESLSISLSDELERMRYKLAQAFGTTYWYDTPAITLADTSTLVTQGGAVPTNRLLSGRVDASNQPMFLVPAGGSTATVTLKGASTNFKAYIDGILTTVTTDITKTSLTLAATSGAANQATVNDATLAGADSTKTQGEGTSIITVSGAGANYPTDQYIGCKIGTEYFLAYIDGTKTKLKKAFRGFSFDPTDTYLTRVAVTNADIVYLMKTHWIYLQAAGTLDSCATVPVYSGTQPTSPASGDYWYDIANTTWKKYNGSAYAAASAVLIGIVFCDASGCVAARSFDFFAVHSPQVSSSIEVFSNTQIKGLLPNQKFTVLGKAVNFDQGLTIWDTSTDMESGSFAASKTYYLYITYDGKMKVSLVAPYDRRGDYYGFYHPAKPWRAVGYATSDGSTHFSASTNYSPILDDTITTAMLRTASVTRIKQEAVGQALSSSCGSPFQGNATSATDITNLTCALTTSAANRPIKIAIQSAGNGSAGWAQCITATVAGDGHILILRDSTEIARYAIINGTYTPANFRFEDTGATASTAYTYKAQYLVTNGGSVFKIYDAKLLVYES